jgi:hypothetical protein
MRSPEQTKGRFCGRPLCTNVYGLCFLAVGIALGLLHGGEVGNLVSGDSLAVGGCITARHVRRSRQFPRAPLGVIPDFAGALALRASPCR